MPERPFRSSYSSSSVVSAFRDFRAFRGYFLPLKKKIKKNGQAVEYPRRPRLSAA
jgi:hypothetical protein